MIPIGKGGILGNSAVPQYIKMLAAGMLSVTYLGALVVEGIDLINNQVSSPLVIFVLGTGMSVALTALGLHTGAQLGESTPNPPTSITLPLPQAQAAIGGGGGTTSNASTTTP